jgi:S1-C subfamily serine protease
MHASRLLIVHTLFIAALAALPATASPASCPSTVELGERVIASTVTVLADGDKGIIGSGSGFFVDKDLVVTNWHVVNGSRSLRIKLSSSEETHPVKGIVGADLANDLAVLRLARPVEGSPVEGRALPLLDEVPKRGAKVYAFGSPRLLEATMSDGIVSAEREIDGAPRIQITAAVSPGSSGGPVTDECGRVIGVAYMKVRDAEALNFAIPTRFVMELLKTVGEPRGAEYWRQHGQAALKKITAERLGVPDGVDPEQWVQVDPVAQRFLVGLDRRPLDGPDFFKHVGRGDLVKEADNTLPMILYGTAGACGALSACGCLASIPFIPVGIGAITGGLAGIGLCGSLGLGGAGFMLWQDGVVPEMSFKEREALARAHNAALARRSAEQKEAKAKADAKARPDAKTRHGAKAKPDVDDEGPGTDPVGDPPPQKKKTPTPGLDRPAGAPQSIRF